MTMVSFDPMYKGKKNLELYHVKYLITSHLNRHQFYKKFQKIYYISNFPGGSLLTFNLPKFWVWPET